MSELQFEWVALDAVKPNNSNNLGEMVSLDKLQVWTAFYVQEVQNFILEKCLQGEIISFVFCFFPLTTLLRIIEDWLHVP